MSDPYEKAPWRSPLHPCRITIEQTVMEHCEHCDTWTERNHSTCVHHRICKTCMETFGQCIECRKVEEVEE